MKRTLFVAMAMLAVLGLVLTGCSSATSTPTTSPPPPARVIKVAGNFGNVPWIYMDNGVKAGAEYELVNEVAKVMGATVEWTDLPFSGILPGLLASKYDAAASSIFVTKKRAAELAFADPYYESDTALIVRKDNLITKPEDMKDKVFGAESGSSNDAWLKDMLTKYGPFEVKGYDRVQDALLDLEAKRIDGVANDLPPAQYNTKDKPELQIGMTANIKFKQAVFFRQNDPLRDEFNNAQNELKKNGFIAGLYQKWFGVTPGPDSDANKIYTTPYIPEN